MKMLTIVKCSDPQMWYAKLVGQLVVFLKEDKDHYWSREPEGYANIVLKTDALVVQETIL